MAHFGTAKYLLSKTNPTVIASVILLSVHSHRSRVSRKSWLHWNITNSQQLYRTSLYTTSYERHQYGNEETNVWIEGKSNLRYNINEIIKSLEVRSERLTSFYQSIKCHVKEAREISPNETVTYRDVPEVQYGR